MRHRRRILECAALALVVGAALWLASGRSNASDEEVQASAPRSKPQELPEDTPRWLRDAADRTARYKLASSNIQAEIERFWEAAEHTPLDDAEKAIALQVIEARLATCRQMRDALLAKARAADSDGKPVDSAPFEFAVREAEYQLDAFLAGDHRWARYASLPAPLRHARPPFARLSECLVPGIERLLVFRLVSVEHPQLFELKEALLAKAEVARPR